MPLDAATGIGNQVIVQFHEGAVDAPHHLDGEGVFDVGQDQADDVCPAAAHTAGRQAGGIAQLLDDLENDDAEIDGLLDDDDIPEESFDDESDDIKKITSPLKISDDDPGDIDDDD